VALGHSGAEKKKRRLSIFQLTFLSGERREPSYSGGKFLPMKSASFFLARQGGRKKRADAFFFAYLPDARRGRAGVSSRRRPLGELTPRRSSKGGGGKRDSSLSSKYRSPSQGTEEAKIAPRPGGDGPLPFRTSTPGKHKRKRRKERVPHFRGLMGRVNAGGKPTVLVPSATREEGRL